MQKVSKKIQKIRKNTLKNTLKRTTLFLFIIALVAGLFPLNTFMTPAYAADDWNQDILDFQSYGTNGWADIGLTEWNGSAVAPTETVTESVTYMRIDQLPNAILSDPIETTESVTFYLIYTPEQLRWAVANSRPFKLMNDLDMGGDIGRSWAVVGLAANKMFMNGNGHTIYNLRGSGFISGWSQPVIAMDLHFQSAVMSDSIFAGTNSNTYISMEKVTLDYALIDSTGFGGGLIKNSYYRPGGSYARVYANECHTKNVYIRSTACSGNLAGPISGVIKNCYAIDGTMRTATHSGAFTSCAGNYIFENCFTNVRAYATSTTGAFVGHPEDSAYTPGGGGVSIFKNCYAAGSVEGSTNLGGFAGGVGSAGGATHFRFENCYSTAMVGMQNNGTNQGGFLGGQEVNSAVDIVNCYATGEVGSITTNVTDNSPMGGFIGYTYSAANTRLTNCFYDKQTTGMREKGKPNAYGVTGTITGLLTKDLMATLPDGLPAEESAWVLTDGTYPQLKMFANNTTYTQENKDVSDAYSKASVCTVILYPSNLDEEGFEIAKGANDYDTVRDIRFLFPLTNNYYAGTTAGTYDISWRSHGEKSQATGMTDIDVVVLNPKTTQDRASDFAVASLAPGVGFITVEVLHNGVVGQKRLRIIPTSTLTITDDPNASATTGNNAVIYAAPEGESIDENTPVNYLAWKDTTYDHLKGVIFAVGSATDLVNVKTDTLDNHGYPTTLEEFEEVTLTPTPAGPGGAVQILVWKQDEEGTYQQLEMTMSLLELFTNKRSAMDADIGQYRFTYRWYSNPVMIGQPAGYLESSKTLSIMGALTVDYIRNFNQDDSTLLELPTGSIPTTQQSLYYKDGDKFQTLPVPPTHETEGYRFVGWSLDRTAPLNNAWITETSEISEESADADNVVHLYAVYANTYTVTVKDGSFESSNEAIYDSRIAHALDPQLNTLPLNGRRFIGWTRTENSGVIDVLETDLVKGDITVYPVWAPVLGITKTVTDETTTGSVLEGDILRYDITITNAPNTSVLKDAVITDSIPLATALVPGSITLTRSGDAPVAVSDDAITDGVIKVAVGDVQAGETYTLSFRVEIGEKAFDPDATADERDLGNVAEVQSTDLSDEAHHAVTQPIYPDDVDPANVKPKEDPGGKLKKGVVNPANPQYTFVYDRLVYTVSAECEKQNAVWKNVVIKDRIPYGMELDPQSLYLQYPDGSVVHVDASAYNTTTRTIEVAVGDIYSGQSYLLTFTVEILTDVLIPPDPEVPEVLPDLGNIAEAEGETADGTEHNTTSGDATYPPGVGPEGGIADGVTEPQASVSKHAENRTHTNDTFTGDRITYTITAQNDASGSVWNNVIIRDTIPLGLEIDTTSIKLIAFDGTVSALDASVYDPDTRLLSVNVGSITGDKSAIVTFDAVVSADAVGRDIGNTATAKGGNGTIGSGTGGTGGDGGGGSGSGGAGGSGGDGGGAGGAGGGTGGGTGGGSGGDDGRGTIGTQTGSSVYPESGLEVRDASEEGLTELPDPQITKTVVNETSPNNSTNVEDLLLYTVTLSNPKPGSLWRNVFIFDYLPPELVVDLDSMQLTYPDGRQERVGHGAFNATDRTIVVPIARIRGEETYIFTYRAQVSSNDQTVRQIVNTVVGQGENPDGTPTNVTPTSEAPIWFTPGYRMPQTGDTNNMIPAATLLLVSAVCIITGTLLWRRQKRYKKRHAS